MPPFVTVGVPGAQPLGRDGELELSDNPPLGVIQSHFLAGLWARRTWEGIMNPSPFVIQVGYYQNLDALHNVQPLQPPDVVRCLPYTGHVGLTVFPENTDWAVGAAIRHPRIVTLKRIVNDQDTPVLGTGGQADQIRVESFNQVGMVENQAVFLAGWFFDQLVTQPFNEAERIQVVFFPDPIALQGVQVANPINTARLICLPPGGGLQPSCVNVLLM